MANRNAALGFIFVTLLIDVIGFGIIIPVVPNLISELGNVTIPEAASYGGWLIASFSAMQFIFSPCIGESERSIWASTGIADLVVRVWG
jgi:DHA1 family tetracycline resistance protein-like MFS transporter